ncbi:MAG: TauD/TfdA family dioxygenase [Sphingomonas sp.]
MNLMTAKTAGGTVVAGLPMPEFRHIEVVPLTGAAGAEIRGVDLTQELSEEVWNELCLAFEHFLVIMLRGQPLTPEQHKAFSSAASAGSSSCPRRPPTASTTTCRRSAREADDPVTVVPFTRFHTDSPFLRQPPKCMIIARDRLPALRRRHGLLPTCTWPMTSCRRT